MENLKENAKYTYEESKIDFNKKEAEDITQDIKDRIMSKKYHYEDTISKVFKNGKMYLVEFSKDYTAFGKKSRFARRVPEIQWLSRIAKEEKDLNKGYEDYVQEFKDNNIDFDGIHIPEFIDTKKDE